MKVILLEDISGLGQRGDAVEVKDGFGRNFLIRRGLAHIASARDIESIAEAAAMRGKKRMELEKQLSEYKQRLGGIELAMSKKANNKGVLFDSVDAGEVISMLNKRGFSLLRKEQIEGLPIKNLGKHEVAVYLDKKPISIRVIVNEAH